MPLHRQSRQARVTVMSWHRLLMSRKAELGVRHVSGNSPAQAVHGRSARLQEETDLPVRPLEREAEMISNRRFAFRATSARITEIYGPDLRWTPAERGLRFTPDTITQLHDQGCTMVTVRFGLWRTRAGAPTRKGGALSRHDNLGLGSPESDRPFAED